MSLPRNILPFSLSVAVTLARSMLSPPALGFKVYEYRLARVLRRTTSIQVPYS